MGVADSRRAGHNGAGQRATPVLSAPLSRGLVKPFHSDNLYIARLDSYLSGVRYSAHTRRHTITVCQSFLTFVGMKPAYDREDMLAWLDTLVSHGNGSRTIAVYIARVKCLFRANDLVWPVSPRDLWLGLPERDTRAPVIPHEVVEALIRRLGSGDGAGPAAVGLSSTFGLRPNEIATVISTGCNGETLSIQTSKGGRRRVHTIPPELRRVLTFGSHPLSTDGLHKLFDRCMALIGRPPEPGEGWHAIRRALVTGLLENELSDYDLERWMGWKQIRKTSFRYFRPESRDLDSRVYATHPFLPVWRELGEMAQLRRVRG